MYKYFANKLQVSFPTLLSHHHQQLSQARVRSGSHASTYVPSRASHPSEHSYLLHRVTSSWNQLPPQAVEATSLNDYKDKIDELFKNRKIRRNEEAYES